MRSFAIRRRSSFGRSRNVAMVNEKRERESVEIGRAHV